jgi:hypothetical protein
VTADRTDPAGTPALARNPLTLVGIALTTASAFAFITYYILDELGLLTSPYAGLFGFFAVPAVFLVGLVLIPFGIWREGKRRRRGRAPWRWPAIDLNRTTTRRVVLAVGLLTLVNLALVAVAGFGATHYMETNQFCGQVCHVPMRPQFAAHASGSHARVDCVACHVSPGAAGTVRAKLNGSRQLYEIALGTYPRPIRAAGRVPAAGDTCVRCHQPGWAPRDTTRVIHEFAEDEANTETVTTLDMATTRIHWHARPDVVIEFATSAADPDIVPYVRVTQGSGPATEYFAPDVTAAPAGPLRRMDCLDCHSRPAHTFSASAGRSVDQAIARGDIDRALPYVRREVVAALGQTYDTEAQALEAIGNRLRSFYTGRDPALEPKIAQAVATAARLYRTNVDPVMKVTWGTYLTQIGHTDAPGCFRCHDDEKKTRDGRLVRQDCELCHKERQ